MMECYGLIGKKLGHSFSADFFNTKFRREGIPSIYSLFELENISKLPPLLQSHPDLRGLNVTIPYKSEVLGYVDHLSECALQIGAVNTLRISRGDGKIKGFQIEATNTDAAGFRKALEEAFGLNSNSFSPEGFSALVLGTGGASKAVVYVLQQLGARVTLCSRTPEVGTLKTVGYSELTPLGIGQYTLIVNTTPLGMYPEIDNCPDIPYEGLHGRQYCFDLIYNPQETLFMKKCRERGLEVSNGLKMLHYQAEEAWEYWQS